MVLYRTDDYNHEKTSVNIMDVLMYEIFDKENDDVFLGLCRWTETKDVTKELLKKVISERDKNNRGLVNIIISDVLKHLKEKGHNFTVALWLYPLENVQEYYSFEGIDPVIYGYDTSDFKVMEYNGEGSLYFYESLPKPSIKV